MIPRDKRQAPQRDLLETYLEDILNPRHELVALAKDEGIKFRQTFCKRLLGLIWQVGRYAQEGSEATRYTRYSVVRA